MFLISKFNSIANLPWQAQSGGPVPWLDADTDAVEEMRSKLAVWAASEMDASSLSVLPTDMRNSRGFQELLDEFSRRFLKERLELDPDVTVQVQSKSWQHKMTPTLVYLAPD
jgi:hypothetical protein